MQIRNLPADDGSSGWINVLPPREPKRLAPPLEADWVIVGAGFTGLAAARQLALHYPGDRILLIDAQRVADGASGRNSGFLIDLPHDLSAPDYIGDLVAARNDMTLNRAATGYLRDILKKEDIECHWRECGKIQGAVSTSGIKVLDAYRSGLDRLGTEYRMMNSDTLERKLGTSYYRQGLFTPGTVLVQPAALARGLANALPQNVQLCEQTPVTQVEYGTPITLTTPGGTIKTGKLLLTTNAFAKEFGFFGNALLPVFTYGGITRQLTEEEQQLVGGDPYWGIIPADPFGSTVRRTPDQRILIRNTFSYNPTGRSTDAIRARARDHIEKGFKARFPKIKNIEIEYVWGGALCLSRNHAPYFGKLRDNVYGAGCHNGLGVTKGTIAGKLLADYLAGEDSEMLRYMLSRPTPSANPPRPLLDIGIKMTLLYNQLKAGAER
ncbi:FAD-binding oxidoreductase [Marinobacterium sp. D7]|uniref:NAD(P)/FAD-dependent oxidoreductase n=1 Tax=Marinobacterium ramblicola TaxID=2849041 RepID=UPI001C2D4C43|nr:FAD-binding oxidoreductase [Marinobacterium ramblicola]MBV1788250.1 FAD-binding oxidoreductase [Marinobacterium ramblicola]